jgi:hypothetical protein
MKKCTHFMLVIPVFLLATQGLFGQEQVLDKGWHHLRNTGVREWSEFPEKAENSLLRLSFSHSPAQSEKTLSIRQYDVKLTWHVTLNGQPLGTLIGDEKDLLCYLKVPPGMLRESNTLEIFSSASQADDIRVGEISISDQPLADVLSQCSIGINVFDDTTGERIPSRLTIVNARGILQPVSATPQESSAARVGHVYTASGQVSLGLPAGSYTLYATRGFEYGVDSAKVVVRAGDQLKQEFKIRREVNTAGWASTDTHIHTFTWSRHGDASAAERAITIAGEGIELPVTTDHNLHVNLKPFAVQQNVDKYFTIIRGNELTTKVGHFNVFPVGDQKPVDHNADNWESLARNIDAVSPGAIILNHARDIHLKFRPFDPSIHLAPAGMRLDRWTFPANAMEVINSGSQQSDQMELMRDWFGMLNGGHVITPVGGSDSHDVSRFIVGQARTYIRCRDDDPGNLDVDEAVKNFIDGNVMVSFGLLSEIEVNDAYGPGELVPASDRVKVSIKVSGPAWSRAERVILYADGKKIREEEIKDQYAAGAKWSGDWNLTMPPHDVFLVAVAEGKAPTLPYWPIAKPYQPVSIEWDPNVFALSGAVWLDGDKNEKRNSARDYAETLVREAGSDIGTLVETLASFDEAVSVEAAALLHSKGKKLNGADVNRALQNASPETKSAFQTVKAELSK